MMLLQITFQMLYSFSNFHEAYYSRGICFENLGNIAQAEVDYKRALEIKLDYTYAKEAYDQLLTKNNKLNYEYSGKINNEIKLS